MEHILKKRKIKYQGDYTVGQLLRIRDKLKDHEGIDHVGLDVQKQTLSIKYNLLKIRLVVIEKVLDRMGLTLSKERFQRFKRNMGKYMEENQLDNLHAIPRPCCNLPSGKAQKFRAKS